MGKAKAFIVPQEYKAKFKIFFVYQPNMEKNTLLISPGELVKKTMIKILILSLIVIMTILISCGPRAAEKKTDKEKARINTIDKTSKTLDSIAKTESMMKMTQAKKMIDQRLVYIEQFEIGKISKIEFENLVQPLKVKLDSMYNSLSQEQLKELEGYLQKTGDEMVDRLPQSKEPSYPMVSANSYSVGSKERAFAEFLISWQKKDWRRMVKFTQKTWSSGENNPAEMLEAWYGFKDLLGAKITKKTSVSNVTVDITATIYYAFGAEIKTKVITARVIREDAPFKPSTNGEWGVNPISTLAEE